MENVTHDPCSQGEIDSLVKYDVLCNRTSILPFQMLALPVLNESIHLRAFWWNALKDENNVVLIGSVEDLESYIDNGHWIETIEGARFPHEVLASSQELDNGTI